MELFDPSKQHSLLEKLFYLLCIKNSSLLLTRSHELKARFDSTVSEAKHKPTL